MFNVVANCVHLYICREKTFMAIRNRIKKRQNEKKTVIIRKLKKALLSVEKCSSTFTYPL